MPGRSLATPYHGDYGINGRALDAHQQGREDTKHDEQHCQRHDGSHLGRSCIPDLLVGGTFDWAENYTRQHVKQVHGREYDAQRSQYSLHRKGRVYAHDAHELGDEDGEPRQPHRSEGTEGQKPSRPRHPGRQPAELTYAAGPRAGRYDADEDEKQGGVEPVCDLLEDGPVEADRVPRGGSEQDEAQSPYGGVGDERLEVGLQGGHESPVDDVDHPESGNVREKRFDALRQQRDGHCDQAVGSQLGQNTGEQHVGRSRAGDVHVQKPAVQRHGWHLDEQSEEDGSSHGDLGRPREAAPATEGVYRVSSREDAESQESGQHHRRAEERVDEELDRGRAPVLIPPHADQQVHGDQRDLEENVEQDQILRREDPQHPYLGDEDRCEVLLEISLHIPGGENRNDREERREEEHPEPEPAESDAVAYVQRPDPGHVLGERGDAKVVPEGEVDVEGEHKRHGRNSEGRVAQQALLVGQEQHEYRAEQRDEDDQRSYHSRVPTAKAAIVASAITPTTIAAYWAPTMTPMIRTLSRIKSAYLWTPPLWSRCSSPPVPRVPRPTPRTNPPMTSRSNLLVASPSHIANLTNVAP